MNLPFLTRLTLRLAGGSDALAEAERAKFVRFFLAAQAENGGFRGRQGDGDLYYTSFALRGLALLGALDDAPDKGKALDAVEAFLLRSLDTLRSEKPSKHAIEFISLLLSAVLLEVAGNRDVFSARSLDRHSWIFESLSPFRREDGGFASSRDTNHSSTYHTFLTLSCFELFELPQLLGSVEECVKLLHFFLERQKSDGGFVEMKALKHSGTNPSVAGIVSLDILENALRKLGEYNSETQEKVRESKRAAFAFLLAQEIDSGGFRANSRIPVPDLLTTFTVFTAAEDQLSERGACFPVNLPRTRSFLKQLQTESDTEIGFRGGIWDKEPDVEYTFYGLGLKLLLEQKLTHLTASSP